MTDTIYERCIQAQRHEQSGKAHARCNDTQSQAESAEEKPEEVCIYFRGEQPESDQRSEYHSHAQKHGNERAFVSSLFTGFSEERGKHAGDQSDKDAHRGVRIFFEKERENVGYAEKSDYPSDKYRNERWNMRSEVPEGMGEKLHDRLVDAEDHAEHSAGDAGEHGTQADQRTLKDPENKLWGTHFSLSILIHIFIFPFIISESISKTYSLYYFFQRLSSITAFFLHALNIMGVEL